MQPLNLNQSLADAIGQSAEFGGVEFDLSAEKRIITLNGTVASRCQQIRIEDAIARVAKDFTIINRVKVEPGTGTPCRSV